MKRLVIFLVCSFCVAACPVHEGYSQAGAQTLSLDSCISMALRANHQVEKARLQTRQREYSVAAMKSNFLPNFKASLRDLYSTANGSFSIDGGYLPTFVPAADGSLQPNVAVNPATGQTIMSADGTTPVFQQYAYFPTQELDYKIGNIFQAGVNIEQPLYMGGKISAGYAMSKLALDMAQQNERLTDAQVIVNTAEAFALFVRATELREVAVQYDSLLLNLQHDVKAAQAHGMASHNDVLKVGVKLDEAVLQLRQAENGLRLARMNLCRLIGLPLDTEIEAEAVSDTPCEPMLLEGTGVENRPEAALLNMKSRLAEQQVKLERSEFMPPVGLIAGYTYLNGTKLNGYRMLDGGSFGAMLNVSVPLFHFGEGRNKVRAARMEAQQAVLDEQELTEQMMLEATREANNLDEARLELDVTTHGLTQAEENLRTVHKSYDEGMETLSDLLEAQTLYQQACARNVEARCQLSLAIARYRKATGQDMR